jgi:phosphoribosylanthranilate isomerase
MDQRMMRAKICGLTNLDDALAAMEAGADFLGFTFYPKSPRALTPEACSEIASAVRRRSSIVKLVGLFVNESPARIAEVMTQCGLDLAQLHGDETVETVAALNGRAYKAFRGPGQNHAVYAQARLPLSLWEPHRGAARRGPGGEGCGPAFLIDAYSPTAYGGTGQTADWEAARHLAAQYPLLLAGGLTPENVGDAIAQVHPWGVDVASGVEASPGKKDHAKVREFVRIVQSQSDWDTGSLGH